MTSSERRAESTTDVIVVGLGAMGSAVAFRLAERGLRIIGLDRFRPPPSRRRSFELPRTGMALRAGSGSRSVERMHRGNQVASERVTVSEPHQPNHRLNGKDKELVDLLDEVLIDPNLHTASRMRLYEEIAELLHATHRALPASRSANVPTAPTPARTDRLPTLLSAVLVDPNLHTDQRMRLHREIRELLDRTTPASGIHGRTHGS